MKLTDIPGARSLMTWVLKTIVSELKIRLAGHRAICDYLKTFTDTGDQRRILKYVGRCIRCQERIAILTNKLEVLDAGRQARPAGSD